MQSRETVRLCKDHCAPDLYLFGMNVNNGLKREPSDLDSCRIKKTAMTPTVSRDDAASPSSSSFQKEGFDDPPKVINDNNIEGRLTIAETLAASRTERRPNLQLQIPPAALDPADFGIKVKLPSTPPSAKTKRSQNKFQPRPSFRSRAKSGPLSPLKVQNHQAVESAASPFSFARMLTSLSSQRTSSLPVTPVTDHPIIFLDGQGAPVASIIEPERLHKKGRMERSFSAPSKKSKSLRAGSGKGMIMLVRPVGNQSIDIPEASKSSDGSISSTSHNKGKDENAEEIPEEAAVCRICMDDLREGKTWKLQCKCKGELALAHEECALKWFGIKGNPKCDVCGENVQNLPVTLTRVPSGNNEAPSPIHAFHLSGLHGIWQDVPVLMMISMLSYFCLLEQLLVKNMGSGALAIALPFACVLGLVASIISSTLVNKSYIWAYSALQFVLVVLFTHVYYGKVHLEAVLSICLAAFSGFGVAMCINGLVLEYRSWRGLSDLHITQEEGQMELVIYGRSA